MGQNDVQKIKDRLGIEEVVGTYLKLEKAGKNLKARCPFHNEKTPSFIVSPDRGSYYCFGCGAKGDIFSFVQEFEGLDFSGALKILADRAGIELTPISKSDQDKNKRLRDIMDLTVNFFQANLKKNQDAQKYLKGRGLNSETIEDWQIGFIPDGWQNLYDFLKSRNYKDEEIETVGLAKKGDRGKFYDRFRARIIFPIFDPTGRPVGFTGRIFKEGTDDAKYLNSPETPLFDKSRILYGFDRAKTAIRKNNFSILVEGQMDLLMCHQVGYKNAVASSGTALTKEQLEKLARISEKVVIAYDSDSAGFKASEKAWQMALSLGMDVKIAPIPAGNDPADIITSDVEEWRKIVKNSKHIVDIIATNIEAKSADKLQTGKMVSKELVPFLASIADNIEQSHFVNKVAERFKLDEAAIRREIDRFSGTEDSFKKREEVVTTEARNKNTLVSRRVFGILFWQENENAESRLIDCSDLREKIKNILQEDFQRIEDFFAKEKEPLIFEIESLYSAEDSVKNIKSNIEELLLNLKIKYLTRKKEIAQDQMRKCEAAGDESGVAKSLGTIDALSKEINNLISK